MTTTENSTGDKTDILKTTVADNVRYYRQHLHLTQEQLAEASNLSVSTIRSIERKTLWPGPETAILLAEAFQIETYQIYKPNSTPDRPHFLEMNQEEQTQFLSSIQTIQNEIEKMSALYHKSLDESSYSLHHSNR